MCFYDYLYTGSNNKGQEFTNLCLAGRMKMDFRIFDATLAELLEME